MVFLAIMAAASIATARIGETTLACHLRLASELEPAKESAAIIAEVVVAECKPTEPIASPDSLYAHLSLEKRKEIDEFGDKLYRRDLTMAVVRLRACRATVGCDARQPLAAFYRPGDQR